MRVTSSITIDMQTGVVLSHEWFDYSGPVSLCKGDKTIRNAENSAFNFSKTLQSAFTSMFAKRGDVLSFLTDKLTNGVEHPQGMDAATKAALNTGAINTNATLLQNAEKGVNAMDAGRGQGPLALRSGIDSQVSGQLAGQAATSEAADLNSNQQLDEQMKQQNYWKSVQGLGQVASEENPLGFGSEATGANSSVGSLGMDYFNSKAGFGTAFKGAFGAALGNSAGSFGMSKGSGGTDVSWGGG